MSVSNIRGSAMRRPFEQAQAGNNPTPQQMGAFLDDCERGNLEGAQRFLDRYPTHWGCHRGGMNGLMHAASQGRLNIVTELLDEKYQRRHDINKCDEQGMTALLHAAVSGDTAVLKLLVMQGAFVAAKNGSGLNALHIAALNGHTEALSFLMKRFPAGLDKSDLNGDTPLTLAIGGGHAETVRLLLDAEASLKNRPSGETLADYARSLGQHDIAKMLADEPARREEAIGAAVQNGLSSELKLGKAFRLTKQKQEKKPSPSLRQLAGFMPVSAPAAPATRAVLP